MVRNEVTNNSAIFKSPYKILGNFNVYGIPYN